MKQEDKTTQLNSLKGATVEGKQAITQFKGAGMNMITVLRLGHRRNRDHRASMHVALVARALGAKNILFCGESDEALLGRVKDVVRKWGGQFRAEYSESYRRLLKNFKGTRVHLTMYGEPLQEKINPLRGKNVLVVVGSEKVPADVYALCDYNIAVGNQPHSEIAALAIFLHEYFQGKELKKRFTNASVRVLPCARGKKVEKRSV